MTFAFNATQPPVAVNGTLTVSSAKTRVGDWVYLNTTLTDVANQPALTSTGVTLTATGSITGSATVPLPTACDTPGRWPIRYTLTVQETVDFVLSIGGTAFSRRTINVMGVSPSYLDYPASLATARMVNVLGQRAAGGGGTTAAAAALPSAAVTPSAALMVPLGESVTVEMSVLTVLGSKWLSDPGMSVVLSLVPSAITESITNTYASDLLGARLRRLLRAGHGAGAEGRGSGSRVGGRGGERRLLQTFYDPSTWNASDALLYGSAYTQDFDYPTYDGKHERTPLRAPFHPCLTHKQGPPPDQAIRFQVPTRVNQANKCRLFSMA